MGVRLEWDQSTLTLYWRHVANETFKGKRLPEFVPVPSDHHDQEAFAFLPVYRYRREEGESDGIDR